MAQVSSRELRNHTAGVLRRVQCGEEVTVTVRGVPAAELVPVRSGRTRWLPKEDLIRLLSDTRSDAALRDDLKSLADDTTEDLGPIR